MYKLVLVCNKRALTPKNDGYFGNRFWENTNFELQIVVPIDSAVKPIHLVKKNGELCEMAMKTSYCDEKLRVHTAVFSVQNTASRYLRAVQIHNGKNFILIDCGDGVMRKVGIVSQAGKFYLLDREICKEPERETDESENLGVVEWFDVFSGVGCIKTNCGQARIYWDCLLDEQGLVEPRPGEWIVFLWLEKPSVATTFQWEVDGNAIRFSARPSEEELRKALGRLHKLDDAAVSKEPSSFTVKLGDIAKLT